MIWGYACLIQNNGRESPGNQMLPVERLDQDTAIGIWRGEDC